MGVIFKIRLQDHLIELLFGGALAPIHAGWNLQACQYWFCTTKSAECTVGWIAHYLIGIIFATGFISFAGKDWLHQPTLIPAVAFGLVTVSMPFFIMQPAFGLGIAASKTPNPAQARLRSLINHIIFGLGLYLYGLLVGWLL